MSYTDVMAEERKQALVRIPTDIYERLKAEADREDRSLNYQIVRALREWAACKSQRPAAP